jgi:ubiquinol-cytochrome c reductase subunit 7
VVEENPTVQRVRRISISSIFLTSNLTQFKALGRLTPRETYDRAYRLKRASHASVLHAPLAKDQWTKPEEVRVLVHPDPLTFASTFLQDVRYLAPHVNNVAAEDSERAKWDNVIVKKH